MKSKILVVLKSIDGGTGTYAQSLAKLPYMNFLVLEKPKFRNLNANLRGRFKYFSSENSYPTKYYFSLVSVIKFSKELIWLKKEIRKTNPKIIMGVDIHANLLIGFINFLSFNRLPTIFTTHLTLKENLDDKASALLRKILVKLVSFFYNRANYNICVSGFVARSLQKNFDLKDKPVVIYNGIASINFGIKKEFNKNPVLISIGRLVPQKDFRTLIKAFNLIRKKHPKAKLLIIGEGFERLFLEKLVMKIHLSESVKFFGWKQNIKPLLVKSDIYIMTSRKEGLPYTILEALSVGLPVISTDAQYGPAEILSNGKYGIIVPVGNPEAIFKAVNYFLSDKENLIEYSRRSLSRIKDFSEEKMLLAYSRIFSNLLD